MAFRTLIKLLRVKHYVKNVLVFLPLFFSGRFSDPALAAKTVLAFLAFCLVSSAIYIINDIRDVEKDRQHPKKKNRPIAAGLVSVRCAWMIACVILVIACALNLLCGGGWLSWLVLGGYLLLNIAYSFGLKHQPIVDIAILASGFLLRVLYGSVLTGIEISNWLYLTVVSMAFYLGLGNRRNELRHAPQGESRPVLKFYNQDFWDKSMSMCVTLAVVFYSLWSVDAVTIARVGSNALVWTVPLVILICMKYSLTVEGPSDGDPVEVLFADKLLLAMVALLAVIILGIIYF